MGFASTWLESGTLFPAFIGEAPDKDTGIILVVPAFDEPFVIEMLDSLANCRKPSCGTEVIIILNASPAAAPESLQNNLITKDNIETWKSNNPNCFFRVFAVNLGQPSVKGWGVGLARKAGMDEAVRRFNTIDRPEGLIVNLDADCTVRENYFVTLENEFLKKKERKGCSIYFEHPLSGDRFSDEVYDSVYQYELHLRYYYQALAFTGFPNVFHTVGSSIAVKCLPYIKAGGMNRRQAGEDFYFVQKLIPVGGYFSLNSTTVYPSPRASERVPFGTGAAVRKMISNQERQLLTYNPLAFTDLCLFFCMSEKLFCATPDELAHLSESFPESIRIFLSEKDWISKISEIKSNTSGLKSFRKRFFEWFNMFMVVKYLNYSHRSIFEKMPVDEAAEELLRYEKLDPGSAKSIGLLQFYRNLEKVSCDR